MDLRQFVLSISAFVLGGCSSDGDSGGQDTFDAHSVGSIEIGEPTAAGNDFIDRWTLTGYTLDDGTSRSVPDEIQAQGGIGIVVTSTATLTVRHDLCDYYSVSYRLEDSVLTTMNPEGPGIRCEGMYADIDNGERSELLRRSLSATQTIAEVSEYSLTLTTGQNEILEFQRFTEVGLAPPSETAPDVALLMGTQWLLASRRTADGLVVPTEGDLRSISLRFGFDDQSDAGVITGNLNCNNYSREYELSGSSLEAGITGMTDADCYGFVSPASPFFSDMFLLGSSFTVSTADGKLTIESADGRSLRFIAESALEEVAEDARLLLDRAWQLSEYTASDGALEEVFSTAVFQIKLYSNSFRAEAFDLCVDQNGSYELGDAFVVVRLDGPVDQVFCLPDDPEARRQVRDAREILDGNRAEPRMIGAALMYDIQGDGLTLTAADGRQLRFVEVQELEQQ